MLLLYALFWLMKKWVFIVVFLKLCVAYSQNTTYNLVLNNSFEIPKGNVANFILDSVFNTSKVPCWINAQNWTNYTPLPYPPLQFDSNYLVRPNVNFPDGVAGLLIKHQRYNSKPSVTSFAETKLLKRLSAGVTYFFSCYVNVLFTGIDSSANFHTNPRKLGLYFSAVPVNTSPNNLFGSIPVVDIAIDSFPNKLNNNWQKVNGVFTSNGTEEYLTIGVFDSSITNLQNYKGFDSLVNNLIVQPDSIIYYADLYLDEIKLIPLSDTSKIIENIIINDQDSVLSTHQITLCKNASITVKSGSYFNYLWSTGDTTQAIEITTANTYSVTVSNGCRTYTDTVIVVSDTDSLYLFADKASICIGDSTLICTKGVFEHFNWSTGDTLSCLLINSPGVFYCTATNTCGAKFDSITIDRSCECGDSLSLPLGYGICRDSSIVITAQTTPYMRLVWSTGDTTKSIIVDSIGIYYCTAYNTCDTFTDSVRVEFIAPVRSYKDTISICNQKAIWLNPIQNAQVVNYLWNTSSNTDSILVNTAGNYFCRVTGICNAVIDTFVVIDCEPSAEFLTANSTICTNNCIAFKDNSTGKPLKWHWYFEGGTPAYYDGQSPPPVCYAQVGKYKVSLAVESKFGYDSITKTDYIEVQEAPVKKQYIDTVFAVQYGNHLTLDACSKGNSYRWLPHTGDCDTCVQVAITPKQPIEKYTCIISTTEGCSDTCRYTINTEGIWGSIFVPNTFSPNGDGNNDVFEIFGNSINIVRLQIFNRWGEKVFETSDIHHQWDGYYKGELQPSGIYVYNLIYFSGISQVATNLKGSITLVR